MEKKIDFELNKKEKNVNYYTTIGILQPILQNRWRILFNNNRKVKVPQEGKSNILAMQATKCKINYLKKEVNVEIEQSTIGDEHTVIYDFCKDSISPFTLGNVRIDVLDGADGLYHAIEFLHCQIIDHDLTFDYASGDVSKHLITFSFKDLEILIPEIRKSENT